MPRRRFQKKRRKKKKGDEELFLCIFSTISGAPRKTKARGGDNVIFSLERKGRNSIKGEEKERGKEEDRLSSVSFAKMGTQEGKRGGKKKGGEGCHFSALGTLVLLKKDWGRDRGEKSTSLSCMSMERGKNRKEKTGLFFDPGGKK